MRRALVVLSAVAAIASLGLSTALAAEEPAVGRNGKLNKGAQGGFGGLLNEMADRDWLAVFPAAARYRLSQASSTETSVSTLGRPSTFSNHDWQGNQRLSKRVEKNPEDGAREVVLMEDTGPGAIVRWWLTTNGTRGELRIYLDGSAKPVLKGQVRPFVGANPAFGKELSFRSRPSDQAGHNLYAPIPYAKSAKVTFRLGTLGPQFYYAINYREYEDGTVVKTYSPDDVTACADTLRAATAALGTPKTAGHVGSRKKRSATLAAGKAVAHDLKGTGAIRRIALKVSGADQVAALRNTWIELTFDGQRTARVPAGHFFGNGDGTKARPYNEHEDFYRTIPADGAMACRWVMPYKTSARVRVVNEGDQKVDVALEVDSGKWTWNKDSMHFHADFRQETGIKTRHSAGTADFRYLTVRGRGVYVGDTLSVHNPTSDGWWGEGDEKVYVDYLDENGAGHETGPVHLGTGTEDYYGYAWGHVETFTSPFVGQSRADGVAFKTWRGRIVNTRVRGLDAIPFDRSFKFDMEILHWRQASVGLAATTYWYGVPGSKALRTAADLRADYRAEHDFAKGGIADTAADGRWQYMASANVNPSAMGAKTAVLKYGNVGDAGNKGYGGADANAVSDRFVFKNGGQNIPVHGMPGYHELALHPGGAKHPHTVARWTAGKSSAGLANISGAVRNLVNGGDSIDFHIYVDGVEKFSAVAKGARLPEKYFDFDVTLAEGSKVDFVLGNHGAGDFAADESWLQAIIRVPAGGAADTVSGK